MEAESSKAGRRKRKRAADVDQPAESVVEKQAPKKRVRYTPKAGKLAGLMTMPMDILFEILGHLRPLDLLHLARMTKQFRNVLMHKSSISIWTAARRNIPGLPPCPSFFNEPQYANYVFDQHCYSCVKPYIRSMDWKLGVRLCAKCTREHVATQFCMPSESYIPRGPASRGRSSFYRPHLKEVRDKLASLSDLEQRESYIKERELYLKEFNQHADLCAEWATSQARDRSIQLDDARRDRKEAIIEKLTELGWGDEIAAIPWSDDLSGHKMVKQPTRLTPRIWSNIRKELIQYMEKMKTQRLERERKALIIERKRIAVTVLRRYKVDRLPMTDIMPEAVDFCAFPAILEVIELPTEVTVTRETFDDVVPQLDTIVKEWREHVYRLFATKYLQIVEDVDSSSSSETSDSMSPSPELEIEDKGKGKAKEVVANVIIDSDTIGRMALATTVFKCQTCKASSRLWSMDDEDFGIGLFLRPKRRSDDSIPLFYPRAVGHRCSTKQNNYYPGNNDPTTMLDISTLMGTRSAWTSKFLEVDETAGQIAANLVEKCDLDPEHTTATDMDNLGARFACLACLEWGDDPEKALASAFTWRNAIQHSTSAHYSKDVQWERLEGSSLQEAYEDEERILGGPVNGVFSAYAHVRRVWVCMHCMDSPNEKEPMELTQIKSHISVAHNEDEPQKNKDYYRDYEAPAEILPDCCTVTLDINKADVDIDESTESRTFLDFLLDDVMSDVGFW